MSLPLDKYKYLASWDSQFCGRNGNPLGGGVVKVFLAGTSTQVVTYSDYDGTKNPLDIHLSLDGRCIIIASDLNYYDAYVYDRDGVMVFSRKNISLAEGEISIEGVVTDIHSSDNSLKATYEESPDGKTRSFDITLSEETEKRLSDIEQGIDEEIHNRQTADENEAEARKTKDDDLQKQIDELSLGDKIVEGDFIKIEDEDENKKKIGVSPTKELLFDEESFDIEEDDEKVVIKDKGNNFVLRVNDSTTSKSFVGNELDFSKMEKRSSANLGGSLVGVRNNPDGTYDVVPIDIPLQYLLSFPIVDLEANNKQVVGIGLDKDWMNSLPLKSDTSKVVHIAEGETAVEKKADVFSIGEEEDEADGMVTLTFKYADGTSRSVYLPKIDRLTSEVIYHRNKYGTQNVVSYSSATRESEAFADPAGIAHIDVHYDSKKAGVAIEMQDGNIKDGSYVRLQVFQGNSLMGSSTGTKGGNTYYSVQSTFATNAGCIVAVLASYSSSDYTADTLLTCVRFEGTLNVSGQAFYSLIGSSRRIR